MERFKRGSPWWTWVVLRHERIPMVGMSEEDTDVCWALVLTICKDMLFAVVFLRLLGSSSPFAKSCFLQSFFFRRSVAMAFSKLHPNEPTFLSFSLFIRLSASSLFTTPFQATACTMKWCNKSRRLKSLHERKILKI